MSTANSTLPPTVAPAAGNIQRNTLSYSRPKRSFAQRINIRMIAFGLVVLAVVGYPVYLYLDSVVTGGIQDVGGGFKQVDLKAMSSYPLDQVNGTLQDIPEKWRQLDGQNVVLYGEMWDARSAGSSDVKAFQLCYSIAKCCFAGPPQVQHFVSSVVVPGKSLENYPNLVKVTGKLHVNPLKDGGKLSSVYQLEVENIEPAT